MENTNNVIDWFKNIQNKTVHAFTMFDIKDFYPSIKETLLQNALKFAKRHTDVSKRDMEIIYHARKSLLFSENDTWIKKDGGLFDITIGAFDGAEVCELVGTYLLSLMVVKYNKNGIGLYRDDGLAVFNNVSGLNIVMQCNTKVVDYLDFMLNLTDDLFINQTTRPITSTLILTILQILSSNCRSQSKKDYQHYRHQKK